MEIKISNQINTRTYFLGSISSISFIEDVQNHFFYLIKGNLSDLWSLMVKYENYKQIHNWAQENHFENELQDFIAEFQQKNLIQTNYVFDKPINKYLCTPIKQNIKNSILLEKIQSKIATKQNLLSTLYLILNYNCNLKCKHCCNPKTMTQEKISFKIAKQIIDEAFNLGINEVCLTGGECTINQDFVNIAEYIRKKHLKLYIFTNGQKFYEDNTLFNKIINLYPSAIQISLYSMNSHIHDNITQVKGSHYKTINIIKKFKEHNINLKVSCFQTALNLNEYIEVKRYAKSIGAEFITSCTFINNINNNNLSLKLSQKDIKNYYIKNIDVNKIRNKFEKNKELICSAGVDKLCITPNLDITPCIYFDYVLGNYKSISIKETKDTVLPTFHKEFIKNNLKDCFNHKYCEYCSYCPTIAQFDKGFLKKSEIICEEAKAYYYALKKVHKNNFI